MWEEHGKGPPPALWPMDGSTGRGRGLEICLVLLEHTSNFSLAVLGAGLQMNS